MINTLLSSNSTVLLRTSVYVLVTIIGSSRREKHVGLRAEPALYHIGK